MTEDMVQQRNELAKDVNMKIAKNVDMVDQMFLPSCSKSLVEFSALVQRLHQPASSFSALLLIRLLEKRRTNLSPNSTNR